MSVPTSDQTNNGVVIEKNIKDEKREQRNARRRASYQKKKDDGTVKLIDEDKSSLPMTGMIIYC
jgi:hypothetical protein